MRRATAGLLALGMSVLVAGGASSGTGTAHGPSEAGARYGQALGAALACRGTKATAKAEQMLTQFEGAALEEFKRQAAQTVAAWRKLMSCEYAREINACRLLKERNCNDANAEIGSSGRMVPGLIEVSAD